MTRQSPAPRSGSGFGADLTIASSAAERDSPATLAGAEPACAAPATGALRPVPEQPFLGLDALWIQVAGTVCNLACTHCFVTCGPHEERHALMARAEVAGRVAEALALGVREFYLTGGEPFLHPELEPIVEDTLAHGPVTLLTNGTLLTGPRVAWLARLSRSARYALEVRVSLDAPDARGHDAFRGAGAWARTMRGLRALGSARLEPIVTLTHGVEQDQLALAGAVRAALAAEGVRGARLKFLPLFALGRERTRRGRPDFVGCPPPRSLAGLPRDAFDPERLQCGRSRAVSSRGVFVCPLLVDEPGGRMADTLAGAARAFPLAHDACVTCWATGMTCANG